MTHARPTAKIPEGYSLYDCEVRGCTLRILTKGGQPVEHQCPYPGGETRISWMAYGPSLLQQSWGEIDTLYDKFVTLNATGADLVELAQLSGRMRGIASVLKLFMAPHLTTEDEVVAEVRRRYQARTSGTEYETPGLGSRTYEAPPGDNKMSTRHAPPRLEIPARFTPELCAKIKSQASFPPEILASTYDTTVAIIKAIQSQA